MILFPPISQWFLSLGWTIHCRSHQAFSPIPYHFPLFPDELRWSDTCPPHPLKCGISIEEFSPRHRPRRLSHFHFHNPLRPDTQIPRRGVFRGITNWKARTPVFEKPGPAARFGHFLRYSLVRTLTSGLLQPLLRSSLTIPPS